MFRDRGIGCVGEAELLDAGLAGPLGQVVQHGLRKETGQDSFHDLLATHLCAQRSSDQAAASSRNGNRSSFGVTRQQSLFCLPAGMAESSPLGAVELFAAASELFFHLGGDGEIHVVAAEEKMIADGNAPEAQLFSAGLDLDQTEITRSTTDIADEDQLILLHLLFPILSMMKEPRIKRCLGFFNEHEAFEARGFGGFDGELACHFIEGGRDGEDDFLILQARPILLRHDVIPCLLYVKKVAGGCFDGRKALDFF